MCFVCFFLLLWLNNLAIRHSEMQPNDIILSAIFERIQNIDSHTHTNTHRPRCENKINVFSRDLVVEKWENLNNVSLKKCKCYVVSYIYHIIAEKVKSQKTKQLKYLKTIFIFKMLCYRSFVYQTMLTMPLLRIFNMWMCVCIDQIDPFRYYYSVGDRIFRIHNYNKLNIFNQP